MKQTKQKTASNRTVTPQIQFVPFARFGTQDGTAMFIIAVPSSSLQSVASLFGWEVVAMPKQASSKTARRRAA